jgi:aspartate aminotransferase-like enzyme
MIEEGRHERWGWDLGRHGHYSDRVKEALRNFCTHWAEYNAYKKINLQENVHRLLKVQDAFSLLLKARKEETGTGFFLDAKEYKKAIKQEAKR